MNDLEFVKLKLRAAINEANMSYNDDLAEHWEGQLRAAEAVPKEYQLVLLKAQLAQARIDMAQRRRRKALEEEERQARIKANEEAARRAKAAREEAAANRALREAAQKEAAAKRAQREAHSLFLHKYVNDRKAAARQELVKRIAPLTATSMNILVTLAQLCEPGEIDWFNLPQELPFDDATLHRAAHGMIDEIVPPSRYFLTMRAARKLRDIIIKIRDSERPQFADDWIGRNTTLEFLLLNGDRLVLNGWRDLSLKALRARLRERYPDEFNKMFPDTIPDLNYHRPTGDTFAIEDKEGRWESVKKEMVAAGVTALENTWRTGANLPSYTFTFTVSDPPRPRTAAATSASVSVPPKSRWWRKLTGGKAAAVPFVHYIV